MKTSSTYFSRYLTAIIIGGLLSFGVWYASVANAAQGCGFGYHMTAFGRCVPNNPGPNATPIPGRPDCWLNERGEVRCWR